MSRVSQFGLILCLPMATASHAAGLGLRQTVWPVQAWRDLGLGRSECYRLLTTLVTQRG